MVNIQYNIQMMYCRIVHLNLYIFINQCNSRNSIKIYFFKKQITVQNEKGCMQGNSLQFKLNLKTMVIITAAGNVGNQWKSKQQVNVNEAGIP